LLKTISPIGIDVTVSWSVCVSDGIIQKSDVRFL